MSLPVVESHHITRDTLVAVYLDWRNNYMTVEKFASDRRLTLEQANVLIRLAHSVYESPDPDA